MSEPRYDAPRILKELQDSYWDGVELGESKSRYQDWIHMLLLEFSGIPFALELQKTKEILKFPKLTPVPCSTPEMLGLFNLRGQIRPLYDIRLLLGLPRKENSESTRLIMLNLKDQQVAIIAERIISIYELQKDQILPPLVDDTQFKKNYISGKFDFQNQAVLLLDVENIFRSQELSQVHIDPFTSS
jgi:chemotaxis signal transduction protein